MNHPTDDYDDYAPPPADQLDVLDDYTPQGTGQGADGLDVLDDYSPETEDADIQPADELDTLDDYVPDESDVSAESNLDDAVDSLTDVPVEDDDEPAGQLLLVSNPPGSVSVSAGLDGSIQRIQLTPAAAQMSEADLAREIFVVADLAHQKAKAAQFTLMSQLLSQAGADEHEAVGGFLQESLELPTPEQAEAAQAEMFAVRRPHQAG